MKKFTLSAIGLMMATPIALATDEEFKRHNFAAGLFYIAPKSSADPLHTSTSAPLVGSFDSPGTNATVRETTTLGLTYNHFFTPKISLEFIGGIPPRLELEGSGQVNALGIIPITDLDDPKNKPLVKVRSWNPALNLQYHFGPASQAIRPYAGLGVAYNKFDDFRINPAFEADLKTAGALLGALTGSPATNPTVHVASSSSWQPIATIGLTGDIAEHWYGVFSVSYMPLDTDATITVRDDNGSPLSISSTNIKVNPVIGFLGVGYRF